MLAQRPGVQLGSTEDGTGFRHLRLSPEGTLYEHWFFRFQPDFTDGQVRLTGACLGHRDVFAGLCDGRVGPFEEPLGREELLSTRNPTSLEMALPIEAFAPTRNDGVAAFGSLAEDAAARPRGATAVNACSCSAARTNWPRLSAVALDEGAVAGGSEENRTLGLNGSLLALLMRFQVER